MISISKKKLDELKEETRKNWNMTKQRFPGISFLQLNFCIICQPDFILQDNGTPLSLYNIWDIHM